MITRSGNRWLFFALGALLYLPMAQADWLEAVEARIQPRWQGSFLLDCARHLKPDHPLNDLQLATSLRLELTASGALKSVTVTESSKQAQFDQAALEVVRDSAPWPKPPVAVQSDDGQIYIDWRLHRDPAAANKPQLAWVRWPTERALPKLMTQRRWRDALTRLAAAKDLSDAQISELARTVAQAMSATDARTTSPKTTVPKLLEALAQRPVGPINYRAARALGPASEGAPGPAITALRKAITHPDPRLREAALQGLIGAKRRSKGLFYRVIPLVRDADHAVRAAALEAMAVTGGPRALTDVLLLSRKAKSPAMKRAAIRALGHLVSEASTARLRKLLKGASPELSLSIKVALAQHGELEPNWRDLNPGPDALRILLGAQLRATLRSAGQRAALEALAQIATPESAAPQGQAWLWATR